MKTVGIHWFYCLKLYHNHDAKNMQNVLPEFSSKIVLGKICECTNYASKYVIYSIIN